MNFFRKLERKFGKYAIPNLMYYIVGLYIGGLAVHLVNPMIYYMYLSLDAGAVLHGQVWRLATFLICPPSSGIFFNLIALYLYYSLGSTLEQVWGTFRFNVYFFMGVLGHIAAAFIIYALSGVSYPMSTYYLNESLFLAFAATFPQTQFWVMGILPIKAKWLGIFVGAQFLYDFIVGGMAARLSIGLALLNFVVFFLITRNYTSVSPRELKRKRAFKSEVKRAKIQKIALSHHKCAVCGRTEKDDPNLEFRYCSKCAGGLEYCMDHLYTHKHVTEEDL